MSPESMTLKAKRRLGRVPGERAALQTVGKTSEMPEFPKPDKNGDFPAVEYCRISIARDVIKERLALGWSQQELANRAGVRLKTVIKVESGNHTPAVATITKIDKALKKAVKSKA